MMIFPLLWRVLFVPMAWLSLSLSPAHAKSEKPNILLIVADDLGFSDIGAYGSEIDTPNMDRLASQGLRFSRFYTAGKGSPTRAALFTGLAPHQVGMGWTPQADLGRAPYAGELNHQVLTLAEALKTAGYRTSLSGKWDLSRYDHLRAENPHPSWPKQRGFDHFYGTLASGQSYNRPKALMVDNEAIEPPAQDFYFTDAICTDAINVIQQQATNNSSNPFFCVVAFTAPHSPLQAPDELIAKYRERYHQGWDAIREARTLKQRQTIPLKGVDYDRPRPHDIPAWDSLTTPQQENYAERMATYAAQVERMDHGIGDILKSLESHQQLENTLIIILSDNGANANEEGTFGTEEPTPIPAKDAGPSNTYGKGWAHVSNAPFRGFKGSLYEGGIASPLIISWPKQIIQRGQWRDTTVHVTDLMPTCLDAAGVDYPSRHVGKRSPQPHGRSLVPVMRGMSTPSRALFWEFEGHRAIQQANWKLVSRFGRSWELYDIHQDRNEFVNLSSQFPAVVQELDAKWTAHATDLNLLPLDGRRWQERVPPELINPFPEPAPSTPTSQEPLEPNAPPSKPDKPNFIVIVCDDLGYGDLGCYGSHKHRTPNIDRMAEEGLVLSSFYSTSGFCTPSRASLLTGCYPRRINMHVNQRPPGTSKMRQVLFPVAQKGLNPNEFTIAEGLKLQGYQTACIGKWHLGDQAVFLPTRQGFDYYYGIPYSNDMGAAQFPVNPPLPLMQMEAVIEAPADQKTLTQRYTDEAISFIRKQADQPFFLYLPHTMPHHPVFASDEFHGKSANGGYGDAVEEIDWSTGQILSVLRDLKLDQRTLVLFTSDNGAAKKWGGSNAPLSGWKGSTSEGGQRVPCIVRWPGQIPKGLQSAALTTTMDILPTLMKLSGGTLPQERIIDGADIWTILKGEDGATSPHQAFFYYDEDHLQAVRSDHWKLRLREKGPHALYDLNVDIAEQNNVSAQHPDIVKSLLALAANAKQTLGDRGTEGDQTRPAGFVETPRPLLRTH